VNHSVCGLYTYTTGEIIIRFAYFIINPHVRQYQNVIGVSKYITPYHNGNIRNMVIVYHYQKDEGVNLYTYS